MKLYKFTTVIKPTNEDGDIYYQVGVPALPEIVTSGDSVEEAVFMAQDAIELVVLSKLEEGEFVPVDKKPKRPAPKDIVKEILVSVVHDVNTVPLTPDVKFAFA